MARMTRVQQEWRPGRRKAPRSVLVMFGSITLLMEAFVIFFGALAVYGLWGPEHPGRLAMLIGGTVLALLFVLAAGLLRRSWGPALGWALQVLMLATGFVLPAMFVLGAVFVTCWWYALRAGRRLDRENQRRYEAELEWDRRHGYP